MATFKFQAIGKTAEKTIYLNVSVSRAIKTRTTTGLKIKKEDWTTKTGEPKQTSAYSKNTATKLRKLKDYIIDKYNEAASNGTTINKVWLKHNVDVFFGRVTETKQSDLLLDAIQSVLNEAPTRKNAKGGIGLSKSRINAYKSLKAVITEYQKGQSFKVKDVNVKFAKDFLKYLLDIKKYQKSTALKKVADLKTVCNDASFYGIETSTQLKKIDSTKTKNENIIFLTLQELERIENTELPTDALKNVRKWLLLGCNIGQRGSDLLKLNADNFINRNGLQVIELKQQKTNKNVTIPVLETTQKIIKSGLPYKISIQRFNKHVKTVCKLAGINEIIKGGIIEVTDPKKGKTHKRKILGNYPKWQLIGSHVCRRSFASNLYGKLPTPLIMQITAHSSEQMLLNYTSKQGLDYAQQIADFYTLQAQKEKKETNLRLISNQ